MNNLIQDLKVMISLLEDPHPGLVSWNIACENVSKRIEKAFKRARGENG